MGEVTIRLEADEALLKAINDLTHAMKLFSATGNVLAEVAAGSKEKQPAPQQEPEAISDNTTPPEEKHAKSQPEVTLETVRTKLAALSQSGKQAEVKALIQQFGANKLTEIPAEKYPELLAAAEAIG